MQCADDALCTPQDRCAYSLVSPGLLLPDLTRHLSAYPIFFHSVIGLAVMIGSNNNRLRYAFLHICLGGAFAPGVTVAAWLGDNTPEASTRSVVFGLLGLTGVSQVSK